jgi:predicted regulator of Ras-like GTPase activity (Roadblock/LC7/MglB family)
MSDIAPSPASSALDELLDVSPQVYAAVILERGSGRLLASAPDSTVSPEQLATLTSRMLDAAEQARTELGREPVSQFEVATPDGHVFVVADSSSVVTAITATDPTVGLVFYDLKTALRAVRDAGGANALADAIVVPVTSVGSDATSGDNGTGEGKSNRWRKKPS